MLKKRCSWGFPRFLPADVGVRVQEELAGGGVVLTPSRTRADGSEEVLVRFDVAPLDEHEQRVNPVWTPTCYLRLETVTVDGEQYQHGAKEAP